MSPRLTAMLRADLLLQRRYGFWHAAAFVTLLYIAAMALLPKTALPYVLPFLLFVDLAGFGFYFIAGLVLFEKDEGVLAGLAASPLRSEEYLGARLLTLGGLTMLVAFLAALGSTAVVAPEWLGRLNWAALGLGIVLTALFITLAGFILVTPYSSVSHFIMPSTVWMTILQLPLLNFFEIWPSRLFYILPTQGALWLLEAGFRPVAPEKLVLGTLWLLYCLGLAWFWAQRRFETHILGRRGPAEVDEGASAAVAA